MLRLLPLLLAVATGAPAFAQSDAAEQELLARVADAIRSYPRYTMFDNVDVEVSRRTVMLGGRVTTPLKKDEIARRVREVAGVEAVTNDIGVLPVSPADDDLRYRVARAIYNHPAFWAYAQLPVPPIHILVERGRITLTGTADTEVHRTLAASLAQVSGSFGVTNRIRIDKTVDGAPFSGSGVVSAR